MQEALAQAAQAEKAGEIPIGAVLVRHGVVLAAAHNTREQDKNPLEHAEIVALRLAAKAIGDWRLTDCTLYVTMEPCPMCLGALFQARVGRLVYGASDDKRLQETPDLLLASLSSRGTQSLTSNNHTLQITGGVLATECAQILKDFFAARRIEK